MLASTRAAGRSRSSSTSSWSAHRGSAIAAGELPQEERPRSCRSGPPPFPPDRIGGSPSSSSSSAREPEHTHSAAPVADEQWKRKKIRRLRLPSPALPPNRSPFSLFVDLNFNLPRLPFPVAVAPLCFACDASETSEARVWCGGIELDIAFFFSFWAGLDWAEEEAVGVLFKRGGGFRSQRLREIRSRRANGGGVRRCRNGVNGTAPVEAEAPGGRDPVRTVQHRARPMLTWSADNSPVLAAKGLTKLSVSSLSKRTLS